MWDRQIPELTRRWRVIRFDLPGHGGAPAVPAGTVGELTDRLLATLDALGVDRFAYVGCCASGAMGTDLALRHPGRLLSLAVVGSAAHFAPAPRGGMRAADVRAGGLEPVARTAPERWFTPAFASAQPAIVDWAVQMVRTTDLACYEAACEALAAFDVRAELGRIDLPALVIVGAEDQVTPAADVRVLVAGIRDAHLAVVPSARHLTPVEQPTAVTDLLTRHLTTPPGPQGPQGPQGRLPGLAPAPGQPAPAEAAAAGPNPYRTEGAAGAAGASGSGNPYADGASGVDRAAGGGRSGDGLPGRAGAMGSSGSPYADGGPGVDRAAGVGGSGAPGEGDTPSAAGRAVGSGNPYNETVRLTERAAGGSGAGDGGRPYADTVRIGADGAARDAARAAGSGDPQRPAAPDVDRAAGVGRSGVGAPGEGDTPAGARRTPDSGSPYGDAAPGAGRAAGSGAWDASRRGDSDGDGGGGGDSDGDGGRDAAPGRAPAGGDPHARGLRLRREVLGAGDALARHLAPGDFSADYEDLVTRVAWGDIWSRPGLDRRTRFLVTLTALTAGGHLDELATHTRAALRGGVSPDEIKETLLQASLYCGLPAVGRAFEVARRVVAEEAGA